MVKCRASVDGIEDNCRRPLEIEIRSGEPKESVDLWFVRQEKMTHRQFV